MGPLNPINEQFISIQELDTLKKELDRHLNLHFPPCSVILNVLVQHQQKIQSICQRSINSIVFSDFENYFKRIRTIRKFLTTIKKKDEITKAVDQTIISISTFFKKVIFIKKFTLAFNLSETKINQLLSQFLQESFFQDAASTCFDLANERLRQPKPLIIEEINAIYHVLFDPNILPFSPSYNSNNFIHPHPIYVFSSLYKLLASLKEIPKCQEIINQVEEYLKTNPSKDIERYLILSPEEQESTLAQIREIARKEIGIGSSEEDKEERDSAKIFLKKLNDYPVKLFAFKKGLKNQPIVKATSMLENSQNINATFFLNVEGKTHWVFKPISENNNGIQIFRAECTASQLNYHHQFPIPLTIPLQILNWTGSAQIYVENTITLTKIEKKFTPIDKAQLHKLVIFDLLFANSDRNSANFLFLNLDDSAKIIGIDHDSCLMFKDIRPLKLEYLKLIGLGETIQQSMANLFEPEAIDKYKEIMKKNGVSDYQFEWLDIVANALNTALAEQLPLSVVIKRLQDNYDEQFLS